MTATSIFSGIVHPCLRENGTSFPFGRPDLPSSFPHRQLAPLSHNIRCGSPGGTVFSVSDTSRLGGHKMTIPKNEQSYIEELAHLYVDGAFNRRELLKRVARVAGSIAAATVALESLGLPAKADTSED